MVSFVAFFTYHKMTDIWIEKGNLSPVYRYADWGVTVPLQVIEFYAILTASSGYYPKTYLFFELFMATMLMLVFGLLGEMGIINEWLGFSLGCFFWFAIIYELQYGYSAKFCARAATQYNEDAKQLYKAIAESLALKGDSKAVESTTVKYMTQRQRRKRVRAYYLLSGNDILRQSSYDSSLDVEFDEVFGELMEQSTKVMKQPAQKAYARMKFIIMFGWALYPIAYALGHGVSDKVKAHKYINAGYNVADLVNKILFGLTVFKAAKETKRLESVENDLRDYLNAPSDSNASTKPTETTV